MTVISYNTFRGEVFNWASQHNGRFRFFWPLNGGWEHWVQAEVAAHIINVDSAYEILREQPIYTNGGIADWLLNGQTGGNARVAIELKCQRGTDLLGTAFIQDMQDDMNKITAGNLPAGVQAGVVGFYYSQGAQGVRDHLTTGFTIQNHKMYNNNIGVVVARCGVDFPK